MAWRALTGLVEWWADEGLRDIGRRRFNVARGGRFDPAQAAPVGTVDVARALFAARRDPWRLAEVSLDPPDHPVSLAVTAWADEATAALRGNPAQQLVVHENQSVGDLCTRALLKPEVLESVALRPWSATFRLGGDALGPGPEGYVAPELVSLGVDYYEVVYDPALNIVTSWTAVIDEHPAQRVTLTQLVAHEAT